MYPHRLFLVPLLSAFLSSSRLSRAAVCSSASHTNGDPREHSLFLPLSLAHFLHRFCSHKHTPHPQIPHSSPSHSHDRPPWRLTTPLPTWFFAQANPSPSTPIASLVDGLVRSEIRSTICSSRRRSTPPARLYPPSRPPIPRPAQLYPISVSSLPK